MSTTIDPISDSLVGCGAAAELLSRSTGRPIAPSTVSRWIREGRRTAAGRRVYLDAVRLGDRLYTTEDAIRRYVADLSEPAPAGDPDHADEATERDEAEREAEAQLDRARIRE